MANKALTRTYNPLASSPTSTPAVALTRRGLLGISLGAAAAFALGACGSEAGAGVSGGRLTWAWQLPTTWDPVTSSAGSDVQMLALVYEGITGLDEKGNPVPWLAEKWTYDPAGTQVTFTLKEGLKFSDGTPLDATAVAKSVERGRTADGSLIAPQMVGITKVTASGDLDVVLDLAEVDYQIPALFAGKTGMVVNPAAFEKDPAALATAPAGSGPFSLTTFVENDHAELVKNTHFQLADQIQVDEFHLYPQPDPATAVASVQSGQYNVARISGAQVEQAEQAGLDVQILDSMFVSCLDVHAGMKPFDDPAVVDALKYGIDREKIKKVANFDIGDVNYQPFPKGYVGYNPELEGIYEYDPEKAKQVLADAGHTGTVKGEFTSAQPVAAVELIQAQLKEVGIELTIKSIPATQHTQLVYIEHSQALTYDGFAGRESPVQAFQVLFGKEGLMNPSRRTDPALEAQLKKVRATPTDDPTYPSILQEATKIAITSFPNTFLYNAPRIIVRKKVSELPASPSLQRFEGVKTS
ncbi:ABC transporter substrate-binding protein [Nocardioides sp. NPDC057577]|uniref:ABC transporter substrate-binding protein n=1 Tax=Nocardioides sp. NPDC057577 TaxID=3346171 RepID=UPI00366E26DB